jgi:hypothetical protein
MPRCRNLILIRAISLRAANLITSRSRSLARSRENSAPVHIIVIMIGGSPRNRGSPRRVLWASQPKEMTMFTKSTKVFVAALVLGATSLAFVADASARPGQGGWQGGGQDAYMAICRSRFCS